MISIVPQIRFDAVFNFFKNGIKMLITNVTFPA